MSCATRSAIGRPGPASRFKGSKTWRRLNYGGGYAEHRHIAGNAREFLHQITAFLPRLLLALVVVAIGWLLAKAARFAVERGLRR